MKFETGFSWRQAWVTAALLTFSSAPYLAAQQRPAAKSRPAPVAVKPFRGRYCASIGPPGWAVIAENAQRVAFGADLSSADGRAYAGYSIFAAGGPLAIRGAENPDRAVAMNLTNMGRTQVRFGTRMQLAQNVFLIEFQSAVSHGVAYYLVIPTGQGSWMIVLRTAGTAAGPGLWERRGAEAMAVARSMRCQVPNVPPAADPPSLNAKKRSASNGGEPDTLYNRWLDKEYYHDSQTGENYWVSPSQDYSQTGPDGPGYYIPQPNGVKKLDPGYSQ